MNNGNDGAEEISDEADDDGDQSIGTWKGIGFLSENVLDRLRKEGPVAKGGMQPAPVNAQSATGGETAESDLNGGETRGYQRSVRKLLDERQCPRLYSGRTDG